eukprot:CAMPEP_0167781184 /NCGR_PEP_ID=MMETSP0111_2-20121227/5789_1 /TAXON_ID=91324 /ORGANISM="Lotharella globosa, Strain CCCM811" /LENGTH=272 /DNA_ID=CAMNT_0007671813 /DNA_START=126 /DNA_END=944 /DNA_ORIENTATION=-
MDATLKVTSLKDGKQRRSFKVRRRGLSLALSSCCITPDGSTVVMGSWDNAVYVYSIQQGRILGEGIEHEDAVSSVALGERRVVSGSWDGSVKIWDLRESQLNPTPILDLNDHDHPVQCVCIDPNARVACSASQDGVVLVWDVRTGKNQRKIKAHKREVTGISLSNTGYDVTTVSNDGRIRTFDLTKGENFLDLAAGEDVSCVETDGDVIFTGGSRGVVKLWEMQEGEKKPRLQTKAMGAKVSGLSLSRDGSWLVAGLETSEGKDDIIVYSTS